MILHLFTYYILLLGNLIIFYSLGTFGSKILNIKITSVYTFLFLRLFLGIITFVVAAAIFFTGGKTVMLGLLLVSSFILFINNRTKKKPDLTNPEEKLANPEEKITKKIIFEIVLVTTFFYLIRYFLNFNVAGFPLNISLDLAYYAKTSYFMVTYGIETSIPNFLNPTQSSNYPYHYFELWLNGASSKLTNSNFATNLLLITYNVLSVLLFLGYRSILNFYTISRYLTTIISFLIIFYSGFFITELENIPLFKTLSTFSISAFSYAKLLPVYLFLTVSTLFLHYKKYLLGLLALMYLPIVFITTAPTVLAVTFILILLLFFKDRNPIHRKDYIIILSCILSVGLFIGIFYQIYGDKGNSYSTEISNSFIDQFLTKQYWITVNNIIIGATIQLIILYLIPVILMMYLLISKSNFLSNKIYQFIIFGIVICYFFSLLFWGLSHNLADSVQLFANLIIPVFHILSLLILCFFLRNKSSVLSYSVIGGLAILISMQVFSRRLKSLHADSYLRSVSIFVKDKPPLGGYIKASGDYTSFFSKNPEFAVLGNYLFYTRSDIEIINLSVFEIPVNKKEMLATTETKMIEASGFYKFVMNQKANDQFSNIYQSQADFIKTYNIKFLLATKSAKIPSPIKSLITRVIIDPKTGEKFILLK